MGGVSVTSHRDDVKILRHHDVTSLAGSIIFHQTELLWRSFKDVAIHAEDLEFDSQAGQIGHSVANGSPPL